MESIEFWTKKVERLKDPKRDSKSNTKIKIKRGEKAKSNIFHPEYFNNLSFNNKSPSFLLKREIAIIPPIVGPIEPKECQISRSTKFKSLYNAANGNKINQVMR